MDGTRHHHQAVLLQVRLLLPRVDVSRKDRDHNSIFAKVARFTEGFYSRPSNNGTCCALQLSTPPLDHVQYSVHRQPCRRLTSFAFTSQSLRRP